jgi:2-methylcitrate dehydratase PrpD
MRSDATRAGSAARAAAEVLAEHCHQLSWTELDAAVQARTKELLLDHLGVAVAGLAVASTQAVHATLARASAGTSTVIGRPGGAPTEWAALANGMAAHALEMDDCTRESSLHPGVAVIPAALAAAEEGDASTASLLRAIVAGYEVTMRAGAALNPGSAYRRGFHPTGIAGVFGAATAAAMLQNLEPEQLVAALGIAGTMASGSLEYLTDGAWTKRLTPGWAAHGGVVAARLASAGFVGPRTVFEGPLGFLHAYSDAPEPDRLLAGIDRQPPAITRVALKPYACCRYVHAIVDGVFELRARHHPDPDEVVAIDVGVLSIATDLVSDPIERKRKPRSVVDAQFSAPFAAAVALVRGRAGVDEFSDANIHDDTIRRLMAATRCHVEPSLDAAFPATMPATVSLTMADGRVLETRVDYPAGEPERFLSREALVGRFAEFALPLLDPEMARALARFVLDMDGRENARSLMDTFRHEPGFGGPR